MNQAKLTAGDPLSELPAGSRLLSVIPERLGDALMTTPALDVLKAARPDLSVDILALSPVAAEVYRHNPRANQVLAWPGADADRLRREYAVALHTHPDPDYPALTRLGLPVATPAAGAPRTSHQAQVQVDFIVRALGLAAAPCTPGYRFDVAEADTTAAQTLLLQQGYRPGHDVLVGCVPGCGRLAHRTWKFWRPLVHKRAWPVAAWCELARLARADQPRVRLVVFGHGREERLARHLRRAAPDCIYAVNALSLAATAALMNQLCVLVTPDTGLLHLACARGVAMVGLFGATDPRQTGPYQPRARVQYLVQPSMAAITPDMAWRAARDLLP